MLSRAPLVALRSLFYRTFPPTVDSIVSLGCNVGSRVATARNRCQLAVACRSCVFVCVCLFVCVCCVCLFVFVGVCLFVCLVACAVVCSASGRVALRAAYLAHRPLAQCSPVVVIRGYPWLSMQEHAAAALWSLTAHGACVSLLL